ncbi:DUF3515 domain-containing protein [Aeromicrobium sp.]
MHRRLALLFAVFVAPLLFVGGCSYGLSVDTYPTMPNTSKDCDALYADLPNKVAGQERRDVKSNIAAAWGDPEIILRCGVEEPAALTRSSRCDMVDDVGWFSEDTSDGYLFTTIGRQYFVSIDVPKDYDPPADALVDLAKSVKKHDPDVKPCV